MCNQQNQLKHDTILKCKPPDTSWNNVGQVSVSWIPIGQLMLVGLHMALIKEKYIYIKLHFPPCLAHVCSFKGVFLIKELLVFLRAVAFAEGGAVRTAPRDIIRWGRAFGKRTAIMSVSYCLVSVLFAICLVLEMNYKPEQDCGDCRVQADSGAMESQRSLTSSMSCIHVTSEPPEASIV